MSSVASVALTQAVIEIEQHVATDGWNQRPRMFALTPTADLLATQPRMAAALGITDEAAQAGGIPSLTSIEQEGLALNQPLDEMLAKMVWPPAVTGCALVIESQMLPPSAEEQIPEGLEGAALERWVGQHPERHDVRMAVGVLRDGTRQAAIRLRSKDSDMEVLSGPDLVPNLAEALLGTFEE
ncbi:PPA1309 family protein [Catenulispora subtropica]|uniref:PPA1309 family protein n=1 Tax=Catenulispora subtropica TaxID=450798 RepID=A0ABN2SHV6_9ACTN